MNGRLRQNIILELKKEKLNKMSHHTQEEFVRKLSVEFPNHFNNVKMLEIGSLNINGSIRQYFNNSTYDGVDLDSGSFSNSTYVGVDLDSGRDVDLICGGHLVDHEDNTYDTSGSCNCFEHNPYWVETFQNMYRMTKSGGLIFITVPTTGHPEHGTTRIKPEDSPPTIGKGWDYYSNLTESDFRNKFDIDNMFQNYKFEDNGLLDLFFYGFKK